MAQLDLEELAARDPVERGQRASSEVVAYLRSPAVALGGLGTRWTPGYLTIRATRAQATKALPDDSALDLVERGGSVIAVTGRVGLPEVTWG